MTVPVPESIRATAIEAAKAEAERRWPYDYIRDGDRFTVQQAFVDGALSVLPAVVAQVQADTLSRVVDEVEAIPCWHEDGEYGEFDLDGSHREAVLRAIGESPNPDWFVMAQRDTWDECLDAIEKNELDTAQAREGNPYREKGENDATAE